MTLCNLANLPINGSHSGSHAVGVVPSWIRSDVVFRSGSNGTDGGTNKVTPATKHGI